MTTLDIITKSFDKLFITTVQNILGTNMEICKWSFIFTSIGIGINLFINSFYLIQINNENNIFEKKINLILGETKFILENNIIMYEKIKNINTNLISIIEAKKTKKNLALLVDDKELECEEYDMDFYNMLES